MIVSHDIADNIFQKIWNCFLSYYFFKNRRSIFFICPGNGDTLSHGSELRDEQRFRRNTHLINSDTGSTSQIKFCHRDRLLPKVQSLVVDTWWLSRKKDGFTSVCTLDKPDPTRRHETDYLLSERGFGSCFRNVTKRR